MRFGLHFFVPCSDSQSPQQLYRDVIAEAVLADELGFESVWPVEQHFNRTVSIMSCPLLLLAAIAERTRRLRLGTAIVQLPLNHPLRVAEELATLDVLSGGRAELAVGRGNNRLQYAAFGAALEGNRERMAEGLALIRTAWSSPRFSFAGEYYKVPELGLAPLPLQQPHPPIRVAFNSPETAHWSGLNGYPGIVASNVNPLSKVPQLIAAYRAGRDEARLPPPGPDDLSLMLPVYVAESREQARRELAPSIEYLAQLTKRVAAQLLPRMTPADRATHGHLLERMSSMTYEEIDRDVGVLGTPEDCKVRLAQIQRDCGVGRVIAWFNYGGIVPHEAVASSMRLFAHSVMPTFAEP